MSLHINHLYILLKLFPNKPWNKQNLIDNGNLTNDMLKELNINNKNGRVVFRGEKISLEERDKMANKWDGCMDIFLFNFNKEYLKSNEEICSIDAINEILDVNPHNNYFYDLINYQIYQQIWEDLSKNTNLTWDIIKYNLDKPWDWRRLSCNTSMSLEVIINNLELPWVWSMVSRRTDITLKMLEKYKNMPWDYNILSYNNIITWEFLKNNLDKDWDWHSICVNIKITYD